MSRIHEALQRAEREKLTAVTEVVGATGPLNGLSGPEFAGRPLGTMVGSEGVSPALESVLEHCSHPLWTPDLHKMLFFDCPNRPAEHRQADEQFRTLRSRLYQLREKQPLQKILVASALPGEGKSFVSANLAQVLVQQKGRRALLIDADLRHPTLHTYLGAPCTPGLSDYLCGEADEPTVLQRGPMENLFFIPGGKMVANPAELAGNGRLNTLLAGMASCFDWIVIDSPAAVPFSDASLLSGACDGVLIVVAAAATSFDIAQKGVQEFHGKQLLGVALNRLKPEDLAKQYHYGNYYYGQKPESREGKAR